MPTILTKRSTVQGKIPLSTELQPGELAVNLVDKKLYSRDLSDVFLLADANTAGKNFTSYADFGSFPAANASPTNVLYLDNATRQLYINNGTEYLPVGGTGGGGGSSSNYTAFTNRAAFPAVGSSLILYLARDTGVMYYWNGTTYVAIDSATDFGTFANQAAFPATGATGVLYYSQADDGLYRWNGTAYVPIADSKNFTSAANTAGFPTTGIPGVLYHANDTDTFFRWNGTAYVLAADPRDFNSFADRASFPATGLSQTLYYSVAENALFRWDGSMYQLIGASAFSTYVSRAAFPPVGSTGLLYFSQQDNAAFAWDGMTYKPLGAGAFTSYPNVGSFPAAGADGLLYFSVADNALYRWNGTMYVQVGGSGGGGGASGVVVFPIALSAEDVPLTTGIKQTIRMPYAFTVSEVRASLTVASAGASVIVDVLENGTSIFGANKLSIDAGEETSVTAATPPNITDPLIANDSEVTFNVTQIGTTTAGSGLKVYLIGTATFAAASIGIQDEGVVRTSQVSVINFTGSVNATAVGSVVTVDIPAQMGQAIFYDNMGLFPATGSADVLYVDRATDAIYRWNGTTYIGLTSVGRHSIPVNASAITPSVTAGAGSVSTIQTTAGLPDITTVNFDAVTQEFAQFSLAMPKKWNEGTITAKFLWSHPTTTTNFGVAWGLSAVAVSDVDAIGVGFGAEVLAVDTGGLTDALYHSPETPPMTVAGSPQPEDLVFFRVSRVVADAGDTLAVDARLHAVVLYVNTASNTDA